ncbi:hypothetical protein B4107_0323 [Bacillus safensis]|nr:hypothetical protein B4107_0323 [Bacillus safensis]
MVQPEISIDAAGEYGSPSVNKPWGLTMMPSPVQFFIWT